jgi:hypothetical protein
MALYVHIGCELTGGVESNSLLDRWVHNIDLMKRLDIMALLLQL